MSKAKPRRWKAEVERGWKGGLSGWHLDFVRNGDGEVVVGWFGGIYYF